MNYYKLKENGTIEQYTTIKDGDPVPSFIAEEFTATERNIIRLHDGTLAFEDEVDKEAEAAAVAEQKAEMERIAAMPTTEERIEAQVMYTALMTDTLLEGE